MMNKYEVENEIHNEKELIRINEENLKNSNDEKRKNMSSNMLKDEKACLNKLEEEVKNL